MRDYRLDEIKAYARHYMKKRAEEVDIDPVDRAVLKKFQEELGRILPDFFLNAQHERILSDEVRAAVESMRISETIEPFIS